MLNWAFSHRDCPILFERASNIEALFFSISEKIKFIVNLFMSTSRRSFINKLSGLSASLLLPSFINPSWSKNFEKALCKAENISPQELASEEDFWFYIQQAFSASPGIINLNNGGVSPAPKTVQDAMKRYYDLSNEAPSYYMWRIIDQGREPLRKNLAKFGGLQRRRNCY